MVLPRGFQVTPRRGATLFLSTAWSPGANSGLNALLIGVISRSYRTPRFSVRFCRRHWSCANRTATDVGMKMSLAEGTRMNRRSGYVLGLFGLNARSVENVNRPFMSVWSGSSIVEYMYVAPNFRL